MYISQETPEQSHARLLRVIAASELVVFDGPYAFEEFPIDQFSYHADLSALAFVRDDAVWSQLVPATTSSAECFTIFRFHFAEGMDNSGFVGWLASSLKTTLGTGVFVTCGQNCKRGGIFDYWGCPVQLGEQVIQEITRLRIQGNVEQADGRG